MDTNLSDDMVKLVRYSIVSIERDDERILVDGAEKLFDDNVDGEAFATWVTSDLARERGLSNEDRKYLRVSYEVLDRWPKQDREYERRQLEVLEGIRDRLPGHLAGKGNGGGPSRGTGGGLSVPSVGTGTGAAPTAELAALQEKFGSKEVHVPGTGDPYREFFNRLELSKETLADWRSILRRANRKYAEQIAQHFNDHRELGDLKAPELDEEALGDALGEPDRPFDRESFDRFTGKALGTLKVYTFDSGEAVENPAPDVHSIWGPVREEKGGFVQRITGSNVDFVDPEDDDAVWRALHRVEVDLTLNAYTDDWGIVSWSTFYQNHSNQMRSWAYELGDRLLWINRFMKADMTPTVEEQFVLSVDWEERDGDDRIFNVYAMHLNFDLKKNTVEFAGPILKLVNRVVR